MLLPLSKQDWSKEQIDVWENVKTYTELILKGSAEEFLKFFHEDYSSWNLYESMPVSKIDVRDELQHLPKREIDSYSITPIAIKVFKNVAIVHYFYSAIFKTTNGKEKTKYGHNTDVLLKQKGKWVLIGDNVELFRK